MSDLKLKVADLKEQHVGKNIVSISIVAKQKLNVFSGDVVLIVGKKTTAAQIWPEKETEGQEQIIKMDKYVRANAGVDINDFIEIKKIDSIFVAKKIAISPLSDKKINFFSKNYDLIIKKSLLERPFFYGDVFPINVFGTSFDFKVTEISPITKEQPLLLDESTDLVVNLNPVSEISEKSKITYKDIGGLEKEINAIKEMIELPIKYPDHFKKINIVPPKGILLYGPPGTGKTLLAKAISQELSAKFISVDAPQIMAKFVGEAEEKLRKIFLTAQKIAPAVVFIDEIDAIAPKRDGFVTEVEKRVVAQLLSCMDGIVNRGQVVVIAATNRPEDIDVALRRPGRFDREIEIGVPDAIERLEILKVHTKDVPLSKNVDLKEIADNTHGFVGADLAALVKEAGIFAVKSAITKNTKIDSLDIKKSDFSNALSIIQPSGLREIFVEIPNVGFDAIGGLDDQKELITEILDLTIKKKEVVRKMGITIPKNLLLVGPPGTGKTMFVKACAKSNKINFIYVKGPEILNKWLGQSEKAIRDIFKKAREVSPVIVFFDEIDSLTVNKANTENIPKVLDQLLTELDNLVSNDVVFIAATNRPDLIDRSLLRSGRIDKIIEFKLPNFEDRKKIFSVLLKYVPHTKIDLDFFSKETEGFSGADLQLLINDSAVLAIKEKDYELNKLSERHLKKVLLKMKTNLKKKSTNISEYFSENKRSTSYIS